MKRIGNMLLGVGLLLTLSACGDDVTNTEKAVEQVQKQHFSVGVLLPDIGLGDQSFNDLAVNGLVKARDELDIIWSYRDEKNVDSMEQGIEELLAEDHDLIIGVGYSVQEILESYATKNPEQQFVIIDSVSDVENIDAITFKEDEGSYLAGALAAMTSDSGIIGFVGGMEDPVIEKFMIGYQQGAKSVNPSIEVLVQYANTYSDDKVGAQIASDMIASGADVLYAAAGYTGVGLLQQAQKENVLAIGVDSDQYFYAEKAVVTSMLKNIDIAVFEYVEQFIKSEPTEQVLLEFGIKEDGVKLAPIRVVNNAIELEQSLEKIQVNLGQN